MIKKAMIMAAGVGSRLEPLSSIVPKPLVPIANIPTMDILMKHLFSFGIKDVIANTYHRADDIINNYKENSLGINFQSVKENELSGTAGGVKKCQFFFAEDDDFIIMSGDGLTDINIEEAYKSHKKSNSIATIVTKEVAHKEVFKYGIIVPDEQGYVKSFQEKPSLDEAKSNLANTGIYIFNYKIFDFIPENTFYDFAKNVFPSIMNSGLKINTYKHYGYWSDIGSIEQYKQSNADIVEGNISIIKANVFEENTGKYICGDNFSKNTGSNIEGCCVFGNNCKIGANCKIKNSILWDNIEIKDNIVIENSIILSNAIIEENIKDSIRK